MSIKPSGIARFSRYWSEWALLGGALLILGLVIAYLLLWHYQDIEAYERANLQSQAKSISDNVGRHIEAVAQGLSHLQKKVPQWQASQDGNGLANKHLTSLADAMPDGRVMLVLNARGEVAASSLPQLLGQDYRETEVYRVAHLHPDSAVLHVAQPLKTTSGVWLLSLSRPIQRPNGEFAGVAVALLDPEELRGILDAAGQAPGGAFLAHGDGRLFLAGSRYIDGNTQLVAKHAIQPTGVNMDKPLFVAVVRDGMSFNRSWRHEVLVLGSAYLLMAVITISGLALMHRRRARGEEAVAAAQAAVVDRERFMRSLVDGVPGMIGYWHADLRCGFANAAHQAWFGRSPETMTGMRLQDLLGEERFRQTEPVVRAALAGQRQSFERTLTRPDGRIGYAWVNYIPDFAEGRVRGFFAVSTDITELKEVELALQENRRFLSQLVEHSGNLIFAKDRQGVYQLVNGKFEESSGLKREAILGKTDEMLFPASMAARFKESDQEIIRTGKAKEIEESLSDPSGERFFLTIKFPLRDESGEVNGVCGMSTDITEMKRIQLEIERLSQIDPLTGLSNRRHFFEQGEREISRAERYGGPVAVLMMDLDHFKHVNDVHGHHAGDAALVRVSGLCRSALRDIDLIGRLGGEEFALLLPETSLAQAEEVAERIRGLVEEAIIATNDGKTLRITVSIGVAALWKDSSPSLAELLDRADKALYDAKRAGRNRVAVENTVKN